VMSGPIHAITPFLKLEDARSVEAVRFEFTFKTGSCHYTRRDGRYDHWTLLS